MSWNDPCRECGEPRYACECVKQRNDLRILNKNKEEHQKNWDEIFQEFQEYRNSLDGIITIAALEFFLKRDYLPPKRIKP